MKKYITIIFMIFNTLVLSAQKIDKVRNVQSKGIELSQEDLISKKNI